MSKLTLEEAISHALEVAERYDRVEDSHADEGLKQECIQCAADHRQLAEWLTELKEARRLLKAAVEDMNDNEICYDINACNVCTQSDKVSCDTFKWRYTDEALKLIGGIDNNGITVKET